MRILNRIILPSISGRKVNIFVAIFGGFILFTVLFLLLLAPMRRSIAVKKDEWKRLEAQLAENRVKLRSSSKTDKSAIEAQLEDLRRRLTVKSPTAAILDELTKRGKELSIEFISITPQEGRAISPPQGTPGALEYKILPIEINMRAGYRNLGEYFGVLENLETSFATVGEFQIRKDEKAPSKLIVRLVVYTYTIEDQSGQK